MKNAVRCDVCVRCDSNILFQQLPPNKLPTRLPEMQTRLDFIIKRQNDTVASLTVGLIILRVRRHGMSTRVSEEDESKKP